jgi:signal transduction histidine kinase
VRRLAPVVIGVLAVGGVAAEVAAVDAGAGLGSAVLDLAAGWALLAAAAGAEALRPPCRALIATAGGLWFAGTLGSASGEVGRVADVWASLYSAPLVGALLAAPAAWPRRGPERALAGWAWVRGVVPAIAAANAATLATGLALAALGLVRTEHDRRALSGHRAAGAFGIALALAAVLRLGGDRSELAAAVVSVAVTGCGVALLTAGRRGLSPEGMSRLIVDLGQLRDARSLEGRLGDALGDPLLELRYRLRPSGAWLDAAARPVGAPRSAGREVTTVEGADGRAAALLHDRGTLQDPRLREAVLAAVRLAVVRLDLTAGAVAQADELAASRRRLVTAGERERERFAADLEAGPGALLADAAAALEAAVRVAGPELEPLLAAAVGDLAATRAELATTVDGGLRERLDAGGLADALVELARGAGATAAVRLGAPVDPRVAATAWFCASEALANALKHAGSARIALSAHVAGDRLELAVSDDGPGAADPSGGGLAGLRSRTAELGGYLAIVSPPGGGTRVAISLPLSAPSATGART